MNEFSPFPVAKMTPSGERCVQLASLTDGELAVPPYLIDGFHRRAISRTIDDHETDWTSLAKNAPVHAWPKSNRASMTSKQMIFISHIFNESSSTEKPLFFFDRTTTSDSCCRLFAQNLNVENMRDISLADFTRESSSTNCSAAVNSSISLVSQPLPFASPK